MLGALAIALGLLTGMDRVIGLVNKLQQICTSLGDNALSPQSILWNKLPTIVVVGGQVDSFARRRGQLAAVGMGGRE